MCERERERDREEREIMSLYGLFFGSSSSSSGSSEEEEEEEVREMSESVKTFAKRTESYNLHRSMGRFEEREKKVVLKRLVSELKSQDRHCPIVTFPCDGTCFKLRQKGYAKTGNKKDSETSMYRLIGAVRLKNENSKCEDVLQDECVMNEILRRWTASVEKNPSNVDGVVRSIREIVSSEMKRESKEEDATEKEEKEEEEEKCVDEKTRKLLEEAKRFSMQQQKERDDEQRRLKTNRTVDTTLSALPKYLLWNIIVPSKEPDSGIFGGLFGTDIAEGDYGTNVVALFRVDPECEKLYENDLKRGASNGALHLFARYVQAAKLREEEEEKEERIIDPVSKRFKLLPRVMDHTFYDAGLGWLNSFNGKPKILRDTVKATYHSNITSERTRSMLNRLVGILEHTKEDTDRCDVFEIKTDVMQWTRPHGIPLRAVWALMRVVHRSIATFGFTIEGSDDDELPERTVASMDILTMNIYESECIDVARCRRDAGSTNKLEPPVPPPRPSAVKDIDI